MPRQRRPSPQFVSPVTKGATFERVDQGVDYMQSAPYVAVGDGVVTAITGGWHGGTGIGVYITLDHPITVNGRTYDQVYYAELRPLVKQGQRVKAGQAVAAGGAGELGFAHDNGPVAPLTGGFGAGTVPSVAGHDFLDLASGDKHVQIGTAAPIERATASFHDQVPRSQGGGIGFTDLPPVDDSQFGPQESINQQGAFGLTGLQNLQGLSIFQAADVWQQLANEQNASPETRLLSANAQQLTSTSPDFLRAP